MGMLDRYKKSGGFVQLLQLIETCGPAKKEKLLGMIEAEDSRWSKAIVKRMLTIDEIFSWPQEVIAEIVPQIHEITLAFTLNSLSDEIKEKALLTFSHAQKRRLTEHIDGREISAGELSAAYVKVIEEVRGQINNGYLRLREFAPNKVVDEDIEDKLAKESVFEHFSDEPEVSGDELVFDLPSSSGENSADLQRQLNHLKHQVRALKKENDTLKRQLNSSKEKITQIKKLVAA